MPKIGIKIGVRKSGAFSWSRWWASRCDTWHTEYVDCRVEVLNLTINEKTNIDYKYTANWLIEAQRNNYAVAIKDSYLWYSLDNSLSFIRGVAIPAVVKSVFLFNTGTVLFATQNKIYRSTDMLQSYTEIIVNDTDGNPINLTNPGQYFRQLQPDNVVIINGIEHLMWGPYTNIVGNSEVNIYHTYNDGQTITMIYQFGQNANYDSYGDPTNPYECRHVHAINYNPNTGKWIIQTGDSGAAPPFNDECHWIEVTWNGGMNYIFDYLKTGDEEDYWKTTGMFFDSNNNVKWGSDSSIGAKMGIWGVPYDDITDEGEYVELYDFNVDMVGFLQQNNNILSMPISFNTLEPRIIISKDNGENFVIVDSTELDLLPNPIGLFKVFPQNNQEYFLLKCYFSGGFGGLEIEKSLLVKIK